MRRLYQWLLRWHPLRGEFGAEMLSVFEQSAAVQWQRGWAAYLGFCLRESAGLLAGLRMNFGLDGEIFMKHKRVVISCALAGFLLALGGTMRWAWTPYVSTAILRVTPALVPARIAPAAEANIDQVLPRIMQSVLSRGSLNKAIHSFDLYRRERRRMPMEDVVEGMRNDITMMREPGDTVRIRFQYEDWSLAQKVALYLSRRVIDEHIHFRSQQAMMTFDFLGHRQRAVGKRWEASLVRLQLATQSSAQWERARLEADIARKDYEDLSTKLAEAETAKNLEESGRGPRLEIMDSASLPVNFRPPLWVATPLALAGGFAGLLIGWLVARLTAGRRDWAGPQVV